MACSKYNHDISPLKKNVLHIEFDKLESFTCTPSNMIVDVDFHSVYFTRLIFVSLIKLITLKCMQHKLKQSNMI